MHIEKNIKYRDAADFAEALKTGVSAEQMRADFEAQLKKAQDIIAKEQEEEKKKKDAEIAQNKHLDELREGAVVAVLAYLIELKLLSNKDADNKFFHKVLDAVKAAEKDLKIKRSADTFESFFTITDKDFDVMKKLFNSDGIIRSFLNSL